MARKKIQLETSKLSYDPNSPTFIKDLEKTFISFKEYKEEANLRYKVFAWIVLMYDVQSPMRILAKDYYERKVKCAMSIGLNPSKKTGEYKEAIENILLGKNEDVNRLIVEYITSFSSPEYTQLVGLWVVQRHVLSDLMEGKYDDKTTRVLDSVANQISNLTKKIYHSGDKIETELARRALYYQAGEDLNKLRPEAIASMLADDGLPDSWGIYEDGYIPDKIKFAGDDPLIAINDEE